MSQGESLEQRISGLKAQGRSVREIAALLGVNRNKVQRFLQAQADGGGAVPAARSRGPVAVPGWEALVLTCEELDYMGWSAAHVAAGLNDLEMYRLGAIVAFRAAGGLPKRKGPLEEGITKSERDQRVWELHAQGLTLQGIADELPPVLSQSGPARRMTLAGVQKVLEGLLADADEDDLDDERPVPAQRPQRFGGASRAGWRESDDDV